MDVGLTSYFLTHIGCAESDVAGIVSENFVFLDLKRKGLFRQVKLHWRRRLLRRSEMVKLIFI